MVVVVFWCCVFGVVCLWFLLVVVLVAMVFGFFFSKPLSCFPVFLAGRITWCIYTGSIHDYNMTEGYLFWEWYFSSTMMTYFQFPFYPLCKNIVSKSSEFLENVFWCSSSYILDSSSISLTSTRSSSNFVKWICLFSKNYSECKHAFIIGPIVAIEKGEINTFDGVHISYSTVKLDVSAAKGTKKVVISSFVVGQSSRDSAVLPLPKLHSSH